MKPNLLPSLALSLVVALPATAQNARREPQIGYLFPAGARAGTTIDVTVGGQSLRGLNWARVSGPGIKVEVGKSYRQIRNINGEQRAELTYQIEKRKAQLEDQPEPRVPKRLLEMRAEAQKEEDKTKGLEPKPIQLGGHPFIDQLPTASGPDIEHFVTVTLAGRDRLQLNTQLADLVQIKVTIDPTTPPGPREIRLVGATGLTNPMPFLIGRAAEAREYEPNQPGFPRRKTEPPPVLEPPFVVNGQIMPGDVDRFRFKASRGQQLLVRTYARSLIPYLADAVPGWFQMVVALYDAEGREVAWADDFRFDPDPVLFFQVPRDGEYELEVRDSIYRGREDFVYRIEVGQQAFITSGFPLGARQGTEVTATLRGWNLPGHQLKFDTTPGPAVIRHGRLFQGPIPTNDLPYQVGELPELTEQEPNNKFDEAQAIVLPHDINGRIDPAGDFDTFRFDGRAGQQLVAEVTGRRLQSPIDSLIRITDGSGETLAWNDDRMDKDGHLHLGTGLLTHHADSYLQATLPADGPWFVTIGDAANHGGPDFAYRLRLSEPRPDFELKVTPSAINVIPGGHAPFEVHILRKDGYQGPIDLSLADAPKGFQLSGSQVPAGCDRLQLTLAAPLAPPGQPVVLQLRGRIQAGDVTVERHAQPADDTMQAFLWRHLVPASEWLAWVGPPKSKGPQIEITGPLPVKIPSGGSAEVNIKLPSWIADRGHEFALLQPPEGISVSPKPRKTDSGIALLISAEKDKPAAGHAGNLILEGFGVKTDKGKETQRWPIGYLPAVPIIITGTAPEPNK